MRLLTCLSNSDNIVASEDGRDAVRLNGRRRVVSAQFNILQHDRV